MITHNWTVTGTDNLPVWNAALNTNCPSGTRDYHDNMTTGLGDSLANLGLDSYFSWNGNCLQPTNYRSQDCHVNWAINTTFGDKRCYNYVFINGGLRSTADVYSQWLTFSPPLNVSLWQSQRRECYSSFVGDTQYHNWTGL
jgi:hypothetical protein